MKKVYELVFEHDFKLYARLYDTETQEQELKEYKPEEYVPELYVKTEDYSPYRDVYSFSYLKKLDFKNTFDYFKFVKNYGNTPNCPLFGNRSRIQKYIRDNFKETIDVFDIKTQFIDIETRVAGDKGFATTENPFQAVSLIQIYDSSLKKFLILGTKEIKNRDILKSSFGEVYYKEYNNEKEMLQGYIKFTKMTNPAIITGFNSNLFDIPYLINRMDYLGMKEVDQLSPINVIERSIEKETKDGIRYKGVNIVGIMLMDLRDLYIKYQTAKPTKFSLDVISKVELGEGKVEFEGSLETLYNNDYSRYVEYGIKDVELLLKLEEKLKLIKVSQQIAYKCGVNPCDVSGTLQQWLSLMYNTNLKNNMILPLKQLENIVYRKDIKFPGGWVRVRRGLHKNITSFDFGSLYPNIISEFNIGLDTYVPEKNIPIEKLLILEENRCKYLNIEFDKEEYREKIKRSEVSRDLPEEIEDVISNYLYFYQSPDYDKALNDDMKETKFFINIIKNREKIKEICLKYNIRITPNACIYLDNFKSSFASLMIDLFSERKEFKRLAKNAQTQDEKDYYELWTLTQKILMNSAYGSLGLSSNPFSFGKLMAESVTTSGRYTNQMTAYLTNIYMNKTYNIGFNKDQLEEFPFVAQADTDSSYYSIPDNLLLKFKEKKYNSLIKI